MATYLHNPDAVCGQGASTPLHLCLSSLRVRGLCLNNSLCRIHLRLLYSLHVLQDRCNCRTQWCCVLCELQIKLPPCAPPHAVGSFAGNRDLHLLIACCPVTDRPAQTPPQHAELLVGNPVSPAQMDGLPFDRGRFSVSRGQKRRATQ